MQKNNILYIVFLMFLVSNAQNVTLPGDIRQHNITNINSSLLNPASSLQGARTQSLGLWTRWQWQSIDADPTSIYLNYNRKLTEVSSIGVGYLQNNTGVFINTGGVINYAHNINLGTGIDLGVGFNIIGYQQELADTRFQTNQQNQLPHIIANSSSSAFILQVAPGINLQINRFNLGFVAENMFDYNFETKERSSLSSDRVYYISGAYEFPLSLFNENAYLQPNIYYKSVPNQDSQFGITTILDTSKFWSQVGYNNFYGISAGAGGHFFKSFSVGALVEFATNNDLNDVNPTFEIVTAYNFGKEIKKQTPEDIEKEKQEKELKEKEKLKEKLSKAEALALKEETKKKENATKEKARIEKDSLNKVKDTRVATSAKEARKRKKDSIRNYKRTLKLEEEAKKEETRLAAIRAKEKKTLDSLENIRLEEALAYSRKLREEKAKDSLNAIKLALEEEKRIKNITKTEVVTVQAGEKYEEVVKEGSLEPGYYLIANVFGTKKYYEAFMGDMKKAGFNPGSFYRSKNKYNYVYLIRYNTIKEAREGRDSGINGRYTKKLWIFRVKGE
ncbi:type IX secretion system PorP/SprF family membrane protein [Maribacter vaceletii]|uniref:Type IX secretion system PorP/SprF family membrane protein n=1 Tax=Maribacter vaceletii TaxID=1206816 RepID=A0A495E8X0_9FLAO|nr:PorP/SprF family type IX secretion system membrane protein [Maribacter vaceletii]RKR13370.1 type IX secretion system PorP/SprF family membrane protein [Maribacter vaceletii]